jgi:5-hydroxyisourate hydrolase
VLRQLIRKMRVLPGRPKIGIAGSMSAITTHVLDTSRGRPASGVPVTIEFETSSGWELIGKGTTDADGRAKELLPLDFGFQAGNYRLTFDTATYFAEQGSEGFYREVSVTFTIRDPGQHYHVPLLLSPFGYSTYRGS